MNIWGESLSVMGIGLVMVFLGLIILIAAFDLWGLVGGILLFVVLLATTKPILGKGYLYPLWPFNGQALRRIFIRHPISRRNS